MRKTAADQSSRDKETVTWRELTSELKAFRLEVRLFILVGLVVTKLHVPDTITVGSVLGVIGIGALKSFAAR